MNTEDQDVDQLIETRRRAERVVADMADGSLKTEAFRLAFQSLNTNDAPKRPRRRGASKAKRASEKAKTSPKSGGRKQSGPKIHVRNLIAAGFFDEARQVSEVSSELLRRVHKYEDAAVSTALIRLTEDGELERTKAKPEKGRAQWVYSK